jgi:hypothetical protein
MTKKDKITYGKVYSKFNNRVERYALNFFFKTLKSQSRVIKTFLNEYPLEYLLSQINSIIQEETFKTAFNEFYPKVGKTFLKFHKEQFKLSSQKDKNPTDAINISFRDAEKIAELAKISTLKEVADKVTKITQHTRDLIRETIEKGIAANKTKKQIADEILSKTGGAIAKKRALTIARTETTFINSKAAEINVQDSPFKLDKAWIPVSDMRTREAHLNMLGHKPIKKEEMFVVGGEQMMYPADPSGSAANVVNCRCAIVYLPSPNQEQVLPQTGIISNLLVSQLITELFG